MNLDQSNVCFSTIFVCFESSCWKAHTHDGEFSNNGHYVLLQNVWLIFWFHCVFHRFKALSAGSSKATNPINIMAPAPCLYYTVGMVLFSLKQLFFLLWTELLWLTQKVSSVQRTLSQKYCGLSIYILANSRLAFYVCLSEVGSSTMDTTFNQMAIDNMTW